MTTPAYAPVTFPDGTSQPSAAVITETFTYQGTVSVTVGVSRVYNNTGRTLTFRKIRASVATAPTGASLIVDVDKGGTTIFTTQANRPTIPAGSNTALSGAAPDVTTWADGEYLTVDVDQVGSTVAGANLTLQVTAS